MIYYIIIMCQIIYQYLFTKVRPYVSSKPICLFVRSRSYCSDGL